MDSAQPPVASYLWPRPFPYTHRSAPPIGGRGVVDQLRILIGGGETRPRPPSFLGALSLHLLPSLKDRELSSDLLEVSPPIA